MAKYDEVSVKKLYVSLKLDPDFQVFFSDEYPQDKGPCREYFFNVLNSVYPGYLHSVLDHAQRQRNTSDGVEMKAKSIKVTDEWFEQLKSMPFTSSKYSIFIFILILLVIEKNGKTLFLLKQSSKSF